MGLGSSDVLFSDYTSEASKPAILGGKPAITSKGWPKWPIRNPETDENRLLQVMHSSVWSPKKKSGSIILIIVLSIVMYSMAHAQQRSVPLIDRIMLTPVPTELNTTGHIVPFPFHISVHGLDPSKPGDQATLETFIQLFKILPQTQGDFGGDASYRIRFERSAAVENAEGYELVSDSNGIIVNASTEAGVFYGAQTIYQLLAYAWYGEKFLPYSKLPAEGWGKHFVPVLTIKDKPAYKVRSFMIDLGTAVYSMPLLKRLIRMMAQLKMNTLHLYLWDHQLCSFRFRNLPLGHENPFALDSADLSELVRYARRYHIAVMPELESWGHVGSITYHYPELNGGSGDYGGASFAIGEKTYALLEKMYDEIVPCLEDRADVHLGLDESFWSVLPGEEDKGHTPFNMVSRLHEILMRVAEKHGKQVTMHMWADHGGRIVPLPKELETKIVIEPWHYLEAEAPVIEKELKKYGDEGKTPIVMGAGSNSLTFDGSYGATRVWCQEGVKYPNVLGVTLCLWETNDIGGRLITLYGGANLAWSPFAIKYPSDDPRDGLGERTRQRINQQMRSWQTIFPDADPAAINTDRGPEVKSGYYQFLPYAGKPVAPTVDACRVSKALTE